MMDNEFPGIGTASVHTVKNKLFYELTNPVNS